MNEAILRMLKGEDLLGQSQNKEMAELQLNLKVEEELHNDR